MAKNKQREARAKLPAPASDDPEAGHPPAGADAGRIEIPAPVDVRRGDLVMTAMPGRARGQAWAVSLSLADLERWAFEHRGNPIYLFACLAARYRQGGLQFAETGEAPSFADVRLSVPEHLALVDMANRVLKLALDSDMTPGKKAAALAEAMGFKGNGANAFAKFEKDMGAHFAVHRQAQMRREGKRYVEARDELRGKRHERTAERTLARGKQRGARPFKDPAKPDG